jgi:hypothetical protein
LCKIKILYKRYIEREKSFERGDANRDFEEIPYDKFNTDCRNLKPFNIGGEVIIIDTSDYESVDFMSYIEKTQIFINESF